MGWGERLGGRREVEIGSEIGGEEGRVGVFCVKQKAGSEVCYGVGR